MCEESGAEKASIGDDEHAGLQPQRAKQACGSPNHTADQSQEKEGVETGLWLVGLETQTRGLLFLLASDLPSLPPPSSASHDFGRGTRKPQRL